MRDKYGRRINKANDQRNNKIGGTSDGSSFFSQKQDEYLVYKQPQTLGKLSLNATVHDLTYYFFL